MLVEFAYRNVSLGNRRPLYSAERESVLGCPRLGLVEITDARNPAVECTSNGGAIKIDDGGNANAEKSIGKMRIREECVEERQ